GRDLLKSAECQLSPISRVYRLRVFFRAMAPSRKRGGGGGVGKSAAARPEWKIGDLVLAKVKGFPAWPAQISKPEKWGHSHDPRKVFVYFFGTDQIPDAIQAFTQETKKHLSLKCQGKGSDFVRAVEQIGEVYEKLKVEKQDEIENVDEEVKIDGRKSSTKKSKGKKNDRSRASRHNVSNVVPNAEGDSIIQRNQTIFMDDKGLKHEIEGLEDLRGLFEEDQLKETCPVKRSVKKAGITECESQDLQENVAAIRSPQSEPIPMRKSDNPKDGNVSAGLAEIKQEVGRKRRAVKRSSARSGDKGAIISLAHDGRDFRLAARSPNLKVHQSDGDVNEKALSKGGTQLQGELLVASNTCKDSITLDDGQPNFEVPNKQKLEVSNDIVEDKVALQNEKSVVFPFVFEDDRNKVIIDESLLCNSVLKKKRKHLKKSDLGTSGLTWKCLDIEERVTTEIEISNSLEKPSDIDSDTKRTRHRIGTDEHLPLVKRVRARMGKESSKLEEHIMEHSMAKSEESIKKEGMTKPVESTTNEHVPQDAVPIENFQCKSNVSVPLKVADLGRTSIYDQASSTSVQRDPCLPHKADKYRLRGSLADDEAALPPSKRLHRALEAMSACAAEAATLSAGIDMGSEEKCDDGKSGSVSVENGKGDVLEIEDPAKEGKLSFLKDPMLETSSSDMCIDSLNLVSGVSSEFALHALNNAGNSMDEDIRSHVHGDKKKMNHHDDGIVRAENAEESDSPSSLKIESKQHEKSCFLPLKKHDSSKFGLENSIEAEGNEELNQHGKCIPVSPEKHEASNSALEHFDEAKKGGDISDTDQKFSMHDDQEKMDKCIEQAEEKSLVRDAAEKPSVHDDQTKMSGGSDINGNQNKMDGWSDANLCTEISKEASYSCKKVAESEQHEMPRLVIAGQEEGSKFTSECHKHRDETLAIYADTDCQSLVLDNTKKSVPLIGDPNSTKELVTMTQENDELKQDMKFVSMLPKKHGGMKFAKDLSYLGKSNLESAMDVDSKSHLHGNQKRMGNRKDVICAKRVEEPVVSFQKADDSKKHHNPISVSLRNIDNVKSDLRQSRSSFTSPPKTHRVIDYGKVESDQLESKPSIKVKKSNVTPTKKVPVAVSKKDDGQFNAEKANQEHQPRRSSVGTLENVSVSHAKSGCDVSTPRSKIHVKI
ncbi:hypothetical protein KI387_027686, partial [Taxus chinensis]